MDFEDGVIVSLVFVCAIGIVALLGSFIYVDFFMCDNTITKEITVLHKYTEDTFGGTNYYYIDTNNVGYQMWGDNYGVRFHLLECNQTYRIMVNMNVSCSEELIEK